MKASSILITLLIAVAAFFAFGRHKVFDTLDEGTKTGTTSSSKAEKEPDPGNTSDPSQPKPAPIVSKELSFLAALEALGMKGEKPPAGKAFLVGRVMTPDEDDKESGEALPVAGAGLALHAMDDAGEIDVVPLQTTNAHDDGRFFFLVDRGQPYEVAASNEGFGSARVKVSGDRTSDGGHALDDLMLLRNCELRVKVTQGVATLGEPVVGVADLELALIAADGSSLGSARTDAEGSCRFEDLPRGPITLKGHKKPLAVIERPVALDAAVVEVTLEIQPVGTLRVRAKSASGEVLKSFRLAIDIKRGRNAYMAPRFEEVEADAEGFATLENVKAGRWNLYATASGLALGRTEDVEVPLGGVGTAEVTLPKGYTVKGRVVSKADGQPVANAIVFSERDLIPSSIHSHLGTSFESCARAARSDSSGRFTLRDLSEGSHDLSAVHADYSESKASGIQVGAQVARDKEPLIKMHAPGELSGHVYDSEGLPREGLDVLIIPIMDPNSQKKIPLMAKTDEEGFYRITRVPPGTAGAIKIDPQAAQPVEFKMVFFKQGEKKVMNFGEARDGATLFGRVRDEHGDPVPNVGISVMGAPDGSGGLPPMFSGVSNADGEYRILGIPKGDYGVSIDRRNIGGDFVVLTNTSLPESGQKQLDLTIPSATITGRVLSKGTGAAPERGEVVLIRVAPPGGFAGRAELDPKGRYRIDAVPEGSYLITASAKDHDSKQSAPFEIKSGAQKKVADILLSAGGRLAGEVKDAAGKPISGASIVLIDPTTGKEYPAWSFGSSDTGGFEAQSVPVGKYFVSARKQGYEFPNVPVEVKAGATATVLITAK